MTKKTEASKAETIQAPDLNPKPNIAKRFTGSDHEKFSSILMGQICNALWLGHSSEEERKTQSVACLEALVGIAPKDEMEGQLAAQMVACHSAAMECFRRAMIKEQPLAGRQQNLSFANKLMRTYALAMEALDKHRGKGQQKVTVEHVHVHQGGQAIVGNVQTGVGVQQSSEEQAHAKSTSAKGPFVAD